MGNCVKPKSIFFNIDDTLVDMTRKKISPLMLDAPRGLKVSIIIAWKRSL